MLPITTHKDQTFSFGTGSRLQVLVPVAVVPVATVPISVPVPIVVAGEPPVPGTPMYPHTQGTPGAPEDPLSQERLLPPKPTPRFQGHPGTSTQEA